MRAEVNARRKRARSKPETGSDVIKPEVWLEMPVLNLLITLYNFLFYEFLSHVIKRFEKSNKWMPLQD